ncbi:hypothetical protein FRB94_005692 [Tulasnella sp. JGI-2019a]|nr:hypothetical protein FRB94_005692 [Tulasnella sp. JGI-2019a]
MPANHNDLIRIPAPTDAFKNEHRVTIHWQQMLSNKEANYTYMVGKDMSQGGAEVPVFIQEEWYSTSGLDQNATKTASGEYEFTLDKRLQYGQKNAAGEGRFLVWHDQGRKPYQASITGFETALASKGAELAQKLLAGSVLQDTAGQIKALGEAYAGDYLKTF